jgi:methylisocitrate lyase
MGAVTRGLDVLKQQGTIREVLGDMQTRAELYELLGYTPGEEWAFPANRGREG